eukprot:5696787-Prorocentrum_lima.AAC.1
MSRFGTSWWRMVRSGSSAALVVRLMPGPWARGGNSFEGGAAFIHQLFETRVVRLPAIPFPS